MANYCEVGEMARLGGGVGDGEGEEEEEIREDGNSIISNNDDDYIDLGKESRWMPIIVIMAIRTVITLTIEYMREEQKSEKEAE